jgi:hypothetical protein
MMFTEPPSIANFTSGWDDGKARWVTDDNITRGVMPEFSDHIQVYWWELEDGTLYYNPEKPTVWFENDNPPHEHWQHCGCGIYAYHHGDFPQGQSTSPHVFGIVALYGNVLYGSKGYRASKARLVGLLDPRQDDRVLLRRTPSGAIVTGRRPLSTIQELHSPSRYRAYAEMVRTYKDDVTIFSDVTSMLSAYKFGMD